MRIDFGVAQNRGDAILETLGDEMLQSFRLFVYFHPKST
jgi:hypothetical protein